MSNDPITYTLYRLGWTLLIAFGVISNGRTQSVGLPRPELITARQGLPQAFVPAIVQDRQGFIWMATRDGLCRYDGRNFKVFQPTPERTSLTSSAMADIQLDSDGRLWTLSEQGNLDLFDPVRETFINFSQQPFYQRAFGQEPLESFFPDGQNRLWLILNRGKRLVYIDLATHQIRRFPHREPNRAIRQDRQGDTWLATRTAICRQEKQTGRFIRWRPSAQPAYALPDTSIKDIYARPDGLLLSLSDRYLTLLHPQKGIMGHFHLPAYSNQWKYHFATDSRGNTFFNLGTSLVRFHPQHGLQVLDQLPGSRYCRSLFIDRSDVLWMGTDGQGVRKYNLRAAAFDARPYQLDFLSDLFRNYLGIDTSRFRFSALSSPYNFRHTFDQQGHLWFNAGSAPFYRLNLATKQLTPVPFPVRIIRDQLNQSASLATDPEGRVWAIYDSLVVYYQDGQWKRFPFGIRGKVGLPSVQLVVDRQALWLATVSNGLYRVDRSSGQIRQYAPRPGNKNSLSSNELISMFADPLDDNLLWIGTFGSGLCRFNKRTGQCRRLTTQEGLPNNVVYSAIPDQLGAIWVGTNQGLCRVDRHTFRTRTYTQEDGLQADEFNRFHTFYLPGTVRRSPEFGNDGTTSDQIILGGVDGITAFDPGQIREDTFQPAIQLVSIQVNNQSLQPVRDSLPVHATQKLTLPHDQNFVTVGFAAMQYNRQTKIRYRYRLEELNPDWVYSDRPVAEYTGLRPGSYRLHLNASNTSGHWSRHVRTLDLVIQSPWWATGWAYGLYGLLLLGIGYGLARQYRNRVYLNQSMAFKQKEAIHLREVDAMKTRFFTNITHEFRTPLTLILTPVEQMMQENRPQTDYRRLNVIDQNAHQLLALINQLLDLSRLESGHLTVIESRGTLGEFIGERVQAFGTAAENRGIHLIYHQEAEGDYWFDAGKVERIVYNLIANAIKFTPADGTVTVTLTPQVYIVVSDTGVGIPSDQLAHIFDRFYQVDPSAESAAASFQSEGTGIGLALVKELVDLQGGSVQVESHIGAGTTFTVRLPFRRVSPDDVVPDSPKPVFLEANEDPHEAQPESATRNETNETPTLLLVEDNQELLEFIRSSLPTHYHIYPATNGQLGLEQAFRQIPDLIISDVMMPGMDGFTLCRLIKEDPRTSHIPVILLTARSALESRLEGLAQGADDYLTKPFHLEELRLRVANLLERQHRLREQVRKALIQPDSPNNPPNTPAPNPFLEQLYKLLDTYLDNSEFGVDELATQMHLSRQHLHRKLKTLTGLSISDFIRTYRLKRATQLLAQGQPVSQTAYAVGFESPAHFSRSFRQLYEMTPSEYATRHLPK
ncbi:hybrid sensor histidine kinase/response regulator transcription factor [Larkinella rosea]|uniref:histidine kinase n=1 Tax=Larkinella rosea TaxID=2025312 RepID=A0A3P1BT83_9BACT|nr:hybrid sensor histidine kinase/response regulator transcription factor [Larkinella rosea]RRB04325.1 hybrid sensor histidine kinase/response regulator [Larkinella rosea]